MKKNRPAYLLTVLCGEEDVSTMERIIFGETTSIGIRRTRVERSILQRTLHPVNTSLGMATVKECLVPSEQGDSLERRCYPEYESVVAICKAIGRSYRDVYDAIVHELAQREM